MTIALLLLGCHPSTKPADPTGPSGTTGGDDDDTVTPEAYHPAGWAEPDQHGMTAKLQNGHDPQGADCRTCHGADLLGGSGPSCADCHGGPDWITECTFCHGDPADGTGAPPRDIDGESDPASISFGAHRDHTSDGRWHTDFDCSFCHDKPEDALTTGHLFDDETSGRAEIQIPGGGSYDAGALSCASYCHGDGTGALGEATVDDAPKTCASCHAAEPSTGHHDKHLAEGFACETCHPDVSSAGDDIVDRQDHVDGVRTVALPSGMSFNAANGTCSGTCHFEIHTARDW